MNIALTQAELWAAILIAAFLTGMLYAAFYDDKEFF